ncbi:hypothetical protein C5L31_000332 [Secundilactobacillus malefermentans]|uniref:Uncharacterized protein n=1 Tax=Secundilactobacillus malefermentans TaxID=176292 RepID=A0A4R5NLL3_9LACO|nr:hypothetical protein C5L31_000332 [Secundilactobacillus malefermentans]
MITREIVISYMAENYDVQPQFVFKVCFLLHLQQR